VIPDEEEPAPHGDLSAERRARRAWLGDAALLRRAEAAEASVRTLEGQLAELRRRQAETGREHEHATAQLAERELELRRVKQREYAEQQLRVEAEEVAMRARRGRRDELDRWQRRIDAAQAATMRVESERDVLAARLAAVSESASRLSAGIRVLHGVAAELRADFERERSASARERTAARAQIGALEAELARLRAQPAVAPRSPAETAEEARRREEMASALAAAVARLRSRAAAPEPAAADTPPAATPPAAREAAPAPATNRSRETLASGSDLPFDRHPRSGQPPAEPSGPAPALEPPAVGPAVGSAACAPGSPEVSTVIVVPRLFAGNRRSGSRLAPVARRVAARLTRWADRAQGRAR
jgi:hypothetical protein